MFSRISDVLGDDDAVIWHSDVGYPVADERLKRDVSQRFVIRRHLKYFVYLSRQHTNTHMLAEAGL